MTTQPTIKDVARLAGVSIGTVDRVVHNRGKVSPKSRQAVQNAIDVLGYRPSPIASALVWHRAPIRIGVCIPKVEREFWTEAIHGVTLAREKLLPYGVEVTEIDTDSYRFADQQDSVRQLLDGGVSGLILVPLQGKSSDLDALIPPEVPYATVLEDAPDSRRLFHVGPDNYAMGRLAGQLALLGAGSGMRCVILTSNGGFCGTQDRIRGFQDYLAGRDPSARILEVCECALDSGRIGYQSIYALAEAQMAKHPDMNAFYVTNGLTQWAAAAVKNHRMGGKIQVFGYERTEMTPTFLKEGIIGAALCQEPARQWYRAVMRMREYLAGAPLPQCAVFRADCRILLEESLPFQGLDELSDL